MAELQRVGGDLLTVYLAAVMRRRFRFGLWDCGLFCADWFKTKRGRDPAAEWRGAYAGATDLAELLERRGGIVAHFDQCLMAAGAARTDDPQRGDIVIAETNEGLTGAIVTGTNLVMVAGRGIISRHRALAPEVAAWSI